MKGYFAILSAVLLTFACAFQNKQSAEAETIESAGLKIAKGFEAKVVMPSLGRNRHIAVAPNGDVFVKLDRLRNKKGIVQCRFNANGILEEIDSFGDYAGTGIAVRNGYLYASSNSEVYRYKIDPAGTVINKDKPENIVTGLWDKGQHNSKSIALDDAGNIYVNIGAPSNACQERDRSNNSPGMMPCPILDSAGGIWKFRADKPNQSYADGQRYATGLRNVVGLDWSSDANDLYVMQHGRDQLSQLYPSMYNDAQNAELPAEEFFRVRAGDNFGWPYCYYDQLQQKKVLAPEYGGDGRKQERCADMVQPILAFPGHWAPNALLFYTGNQFPEKYRNGAFIAFHGSWNRAPLRQAGYNVVFVPMKNGMPTGAFEVFAEGFTQKEYIMSTGEAKYRPCGLSQTPRGTLLISDSREGRIWEISWKGQ